MSATSSSPFETPAAPTPSLPPDPTVSLHAADALAALSSVDLSSNDMRETTDGLPIDLVATAWTLVPAPAALQSGTRVSSPASSSGPTFVLKKLIGQGGFGEVWEATQLSLGRTIAVKRVREDLYTKQTSETTSNRRLETVFEQEAKITAGLDHPNIVPIHELGRDEFGRPLLALKLVRGRPWHHLIRDDWNALTVEEFLARHLARLIGVTQAIAFAHHRGIVHRDIKPSQVMVGDFGETFLMDWGVAMVHDETRLAASGLSAESLPSIARSDSATNPSGTVAFMAPEQTLPTTRHIGPWTDVFLLGGTLYYLLTGTPPYDGLDPHAVFLAAHMGMVQNPTERSDAREMPEELVTLCMRAMATKPEERIASAEEFLAGIEAYFSGATRRKQAETKVHEAMDRLARAQGQYREFAACEMLLQDARALYPSLIGLGALMDRVHLAYAAAALGNGDLTLAQLQADLIEDAEDKKSVEDAIATRTKAAIRMKRQRKALFASCLILATALALGANQQALERQRAAEALAAERDEAQAAQQRAEQMMEFMLFDLRTSLGRLNQTVLLNDVAEEVAQYYRGNPNEELTTPRMLRRAQLHNILSEIEENRGRLDNAMRQTMAREGWLELLHRREPQNRDISERLVENHSRRARLLSAQGKHIEAIAEAEAALAEAKALYGPAPADNDAIRNIAVAENVLGVLLRDAGRPAEALELFHQSLTSRLKVLADKPNELILLREAATGYNNVGAALRSLDRDDEALEAMKEALVLRERIAALEPENLNARRDYASSLVNIGAVYEHLDRDADAIPYGELAVAAYRQLSREDPLNSDWERRLGGGLYNLSGSYFEMARTAEADETLSEALTIQRRLVARDPTNAAWALELSYSENNRGYNAERRGDWVGALDGYQDATELREELVSRDPDNTALRLSATNAVLAVALAHDKLANIPAREESVQRAMDHLGAYRSSGGAMTPNALGSIMLTLRDLGRQDLVTSIVEESVLRAPDPSEMQLRWADFGLVEAAE